MMTRATSVGRNSLPLPVGLQWFGAERVMGTYRGGLVGNQPENRDSGKLAQLCLRVCQIPSAASPLHLLVMQRTLEPHASRPMQ